MHICGLTSYLEEIFIFAMWKIIYFHNFECIRLKKGCYATCKVVTYLHLDFCLKEKVKLQVWKIVYFHNLQCTYLKNWCYVACKIQINFWLKSSFICISMIICYWPLPHAYCLIGIIIVLFKVPTFSDNKFPLCFQVLFTFSIPFMNILHTFQFSKKIFIIF